MNQEIGAIEEQARQALSALKTAEDLEAFRIAYLGKKGKLKTLMDTLKTLEGDERKSFGQAVNVLKRFLEESVQSGGKRFTASHAPTVPFDETLPGIQPAAGRIHPITATIEEVTAIFERLGFQVAEGPEIETEFYNFTALNIPLDHPSRDSFDTFYTESGSLLRSQTSTVQIRVMQGRKPPLKVISPGRVYRPDAVDASHSFMFHQIEGLMVDDRTTFSDLKGILHFFLRELFGSDIALRFRPHFFPFTEPSVEVDIRWGKGWLEILGAGCVDPNVFEAVGYEAKYQGFAFGMGVERIAMLRHGIQDIRLFTQNDLRFLRQFP